MTYRNMAVKVGNVNKPLLANTVNIDFSTKNQINRQLAANIDPDDQLRFDGALDCKISFDFVVRSSQDSYDALNFLFDSYQSTGQSALTLYVGGNTYNVSYLDSYSLTVKPFEPVIGNASFSCFRPSPTTTDLLGSQSLDVDAVLDTDNIIYGHDCVLQNAGNVVASNLVSNITYSKTYSRTPVYTLGSTRATSQLLDGVEVNMTVDSTGLNSLIDYDGNKLTSDFGVLLEDGSNSGISYNSSDFDLTVSSGAYVVSEGYSVNGGDTLVTKASIKEVIL